MFEWKKLLALAAESLVLVARTFETVTAKLGVAGQ